MLLVISRESTYPGITCALIISVALILVVQGCTYLLHALVRPPQRKLLTVERYWRRDAMGTAHQDDGNSQLVEHDLLSFNGVRVCFPTGDLSLLRSL